jgi:uncharacterized protein (TIGR03083 family)
MTTIDLAALEAQTKELLALLSELTEADWETPTRCPGWTVKELVAHCESMMRRLVGENSAEVGGTAEIDRVGYYGYDPDGPRADEPDKTFSDSIRDRVIEEVRGRSAEELRADTEEAAAAMLEGVKTIPAERVIKRSGHARITFGEFIATRVLEFGVHTMDIGHATLKGERIHPDATAVIVDILSRQLGAPLPKGMGWDARTLVLSGTGRRKLESNERFALGALASKFPLLR